MEEILRLISEGSIDEAIKKLKNRPTFADDVTREVVEKQYNVRKHDVFDKGKRPDKQVTKPTGQKDPTTGDDIMTTVLEPVTRIGISLQKLIVERSVGFMLGNPIVPKSRMRNESDASLKILEMVEKVFHDNKMEYKDMDIFRYLLSECEVAELWHFVEKEDYWGDLSKSKLCPKLHILAPSLGYELYPTFGADGDMVAFSVGYKTKDGSKNIEHFDVYTPEKLYKYKKVDAWALDDTKDSPGKIAIVYHKINQPDWWDIQSEIDRLENLVSNHGDTNDYNGSPILFFKGSITGFASKGERGKVLTGSDNTDAKYLEWSSAPESINLEHGNLRQSIFELTQTPDISFESVKSMGTLSGIALKLMFIDAHLKATKNWGIYGIGVQRRINIILAMITNVVEVSLKPELKNLTVWPQMEPYLPSNVQEMAQIVDNALVAGSISRRTAHENHPLVADADQEEERMNNEGVDLLDGSAV